MKNKGGRPPKIIDYDLLSKLCRIQCTGEECAAVLDMSYETLNNKLKAEGHGGFLDYYKRFAGEGKASLRRMQWKNAESGNSTMQIWLGKQYLGQKEPEKDADEDDSRLADIMGQFAQALSDIAKPKNPAG